MENLNIVMGLNGVMFLSIIAVYAWAWKVSNATKTELGKIYALVNRHIQVQGIHRDEKHFVEQKVCNVLNKAMNEKVDAISEKQIMVMADLGEVKGDVKTILAKVE